MNAYDEMVIRWKEETKDNPLSWSAIADLLGSLDPKEEEGVAPMITTTFGISLTDAKNLRQGQALNATHYATNDPLVDSNGELSRFKVTSVKTWKRQPERVEIHLKRGLREFHVINESDLSRVRIA